MGWVTGESRYSRPLFLDEKEIFHSILNKNFKYLFNFLEYNCYTLNETTHNKLNDIHWGRGGRRGRGVEAMGEGGGGKVPKMDAAECQQRTLVEGMQESLYLQWCS